MNATLLRAVRGRMESQTTEQLLDLWVTNDRATWSPEAFEAARLILADRGHTELPAQNDPAPVGSRWSAADQPETVYWMGWLRPLLWLCIALAALGLVRGPFTLWTLGRVIFAPSTTRWTLPELVNPILSDVISPAWLLLGAATCLRLRPWGRIMLVTYWVPVLTQNAWYMYQTFESFLSYRGGAGWSTFTFGITLLEALVRGMVLPAILFLYLRRVEMKSLFLPTTTGFTVATKTSDAPPLTDG